MFLAVHRQLNRWPCHSLTHWLTEPLLIFDIKERPLRPSWPTYLTYLPDLPTWPTFLTYLTDLPNWPTYLTYLPDLPTWPTYLTYLAFLPTCLPELPYLPELHTYIFTFLPSLKTPFRSNHRDLWHLRHWLWFWQLRTWIHDNLCYLTIKSDSGQHSQFLRCLLVELRDALR